MGGNSHERAAHKGDCLSFKAVKSLGLLYHGNIVVAHRRDDGVVLPSVIGVLGNKTHAVHAFIGIRGVFCRSEEGCGKGNDCACKN